MKTIEEILEEFDKEFCIDYAEKLFGDRNELKKAGWTVPPPKMELKQGIDTNKLKTFLKTSLQTIQKETRKEVVGEHKIINHCSRCGADFPPLGKVLKWGKHYPSYTVKELAKDAAPVERKIKASTEIIEAVCVCCAKEMYDENKIKETRKEVIKECLPDYTGGQEDYDKGWSDCIDQIKSKLKQYE